MTKNTVKKTVKCKICNKEKSFNDVLAVEIVNDGVTAVIKSKNPNWSQEGYICFSDLSQYRTEYIKNLLKEEKGELSSIENEVIDSLKKHEMLSQNINKQFEKELTFGEKIADKVAEFGGSWRFIISFGTFLVVWIIINTLILLSRPFDPFPFIFLNLILSCLAAIQAPVIMMSQNRQESKDRLRSEQEYKVNLKSELMIRHLNRKVDQLLSNQWQRLLEIQQIQLELMEQVAEKKNR
jgi:uncharacterized membrane protein